MYPIEPIFYLRAVQFDYFGNDQYQVTSLIDEVITDGNFVLYAYINVISVKNQKINIKMKVRGITPLTFLLFIQFDTHFYNPAGGILDVLRLPCVPVKFMGDVLCGKVEVFAADCIPDS